VNENAAYIFDVEEPREWIFTGEPVWISGWFVSKIGAVFSDVRAIIDGVPHMGIFGLPRENIERQYRGYFGLPHVGFSLCVLPPRGAKSLRLELLDVGGRWVEILRTGIKVKRGPAPGARVNPEVVADQLRKLLQARRADPAGELLPLARRLALESAAVPLDTLPVPPFFGSLENPLLTGGSQFGKLKVEGWIIHQEQRIGRLVATTHPLADNEMDYGNRERAEAAELFPDHPHAGRSQFFGMVDIDERAGDPVCLKIFAELEDRTWHLVFVRRFYQRGCIQMERPLPEFSHATFIEAVRTFWKGCRAEKVSVGDLGDFWRNCRRAFRLFKRFAPETIPGASPAEADPYRAWVAANAFTPRRRQLLETAVRRIEADGPRFTILADTRGCTREQLQDLATSLTNQIYPHWQAWFVGPMAAPGGDDRFHGGANGKARNFIPALNSAAHQARGTHLTLLPGHSRLSPDALVEIADCIINRPGLELIYTDEDRMDDACVRSAPKFKPAWSPTLADSGLFPGHLSVVRQDRFVELGSFRPGFETVPWFDVLLRISDKMPDEKVIHLPIVCHHARALPEAVEATDLSIEQTRQALIEATRRRGWKAEPFLPGIAHHRLSRFHQLHWDKGILTHLQVTIVIPTRDKLHLLQECVELLDETVDWRYVKLVIVDDHSRDADAVRYLNTIQKRNDLMCTVVRPEDPGAPFNYAHLVNLAMPHVDTPLVLHLNNDVNALERGWLEEMTGWFTQPDIGVVGAKLVYPQKTLNHTGIVIGPHGGLADTPFAQASESDVPELEWFATAREVSAVTGACLMTRAEIYRNLGGFDEAKFGVSYNDVDYCLRVRQAGYRIIYTPQAMLMHWGSATRGVTFDEAEHIAFVRRYPSYRDPYFSRNLELKDGRVRCHAGAVPRQADRTGKLRLLLLTHNLNLEGAPLFLVEYATYMARNAGFGVEVLTSKDGPLRSTLEELGAHITVIDSAPLYASPDEDIFHERLEILTHSLDWDRIDLVVCNTLVSFWGVQMAKRAGKPSLFYIHESTTVFRFFETKLELHLHHLVHEALGCATHTLFLCAATRAYYEDSNRHDNFRIVPSWIHLDAIDEFRRKHPRAEMRRKHGLADDEIVIANIGTVCERKGQHTFIRAIDHFNHNQGHRAKFRFVMVGARPGIYLDLLLRDLKRLGLPNVTLVPETREVFDFFVAADLFVCTSYEESFPRVIMEAMGFRTPMVTTDVHGIVEMIGQRQEGYLVPPGDHVALSKMMWTCLAKERSGKSLPPTAYSKVLRYYDYDKVLPFHVELARESVLAGE